MTSSTATIEESAVAGTAALEAALDLAVQTVDDRRRTAPDLAPDLTPSGDVPAIFQPRMDDRHLVASPSPSRLGGVGARGLRSGCRLPAADRSAGGPAVRTRVSDGRRRSATGDGRRLVRLGLAYHAYACVLNDLADAPTDRLDPSRRSAPLVGGPLTTAHAIRAAVVLGIALLACAAIAPEPARLPLAGLIALVSYGNVRQKRSTWIAPGAMDALWGLAMAAPVLVVVAASRTASGTTGGASSGTTAPMWWFAAMFGIQMDLFNGVAGNLKELNHDLAVGARTVATAFGVRPDDSGAVRFTMRYRMYCLALLGLSAGTSAAVIATADLSSTETITFVAGTAAAQLFSLVSLLRLDTARRQPSRSGREPFLLGQFATVFILLLAFTTVIKVLILLLCVLGWTLLFPRLERLLARPTAARTTESQ